jgi:hypothetical protein
VIYALLRGGVPVAKEISEKLKTENRKPFFNGGNRNPAKQNRDKSEKLPTKQSAIRYHNN